MKEKSIVKKKPLIFRRWNNKGYAVFSSLKKSIVIGCLLVSYLLFANPNAVAAQDDSTAVTKNYDLESIDVTAEQLPETYSSISRVVASITKSEIERAAVSTFNELLEYAANIDIKQRGTNGVQADISIRGGSFDQVLVLLNGVNITDPQTGHHNLNLPIDLNSIERIEILKGPGSWKFGPGAFSGAVNIITGTSEVNTIKVQLNAGQFKLNEEKVNIGFHLKNTSHLLAANHASSDGYVSNTDYKITNLFYHGKISMEKSELSLQAGATDKAFGANSFYTAKYPDQYEETQTYFASASFKTQFKKLQFEPRIYFRRNNDRFVLFRNEAPSWYTKDNYHTSNVFGTNLLANYMHGTNAVTSFGIDERLESIMSTNLGELSTDVVFSPVNDTIALDHFHSRSNFSAFIGHKHYFNQFVVNVGLNASSNSDIAGKWFFFPGVDMNYNLDKHSSFFASANKTMRMPTYTDLYYTGPSNQGNPDLLPEQAIGYELGYKYQHEMVQYSFTGFYVQGENLIDWVRQADETVWKTLNYAELNTVGFEFELKTNLQEVFPSQGIFRDFKINYTNVNQTKVETDLVSNYSLNYLKHRIDIALNHIIWKGIRANWHVAFQDRNGQYEQIVDKVSEGLVDYAPFACTDLKIYWNHKGWNIYSSLNNLFNVNYYDIGNVPQPGRWIKFGLAKKLEF
ncbi:MAG: TonB-dependent receptor plug domain-containing protein [Prolixibacteraceae bacterium]